MIPTPISTRLRTCPNPKCQTTLLAGKVPEAHSHLYVGKYFYRTVGFYARDTTLFYFCPDCKGAWHRFHPDSRHYPVASQIMLDHKFIDYTPKTLEVTHA